MQQKLEKLIGKWIWKEQQAQVGNLEMCGDKEEGGLGLVNLKAKLLALWAWWGRWFAESQDLQLKQVLWWLLQRKYRSWRVQGMGWEGVVLHLREDVIDL